MISFFEVKIESIIEYEPGISNIGLELQHARDDFYCRVFILYANADDADIIFQEINRKQMDRSDFVWIVSEQALTAKSSFDGILSIKLKLSEENLMIKDSVGILTNALREMYHSQNITAPPTNCQTPNNKWQTGQLLYQFLKKQNFNGRSGQITFDDSGDRLFSEYEILNIFNNTEQSVGKYSFNSNEMKMKLSLSVNSIRWPGNELQKPLGDFKAKF